MENKYCVRIIKSEIHNFKNVINGEIKYVNYGSVNRLGELTNTDIVGIYGQNGSGKTALIEAMDILKYIISGKAVPFDMYEGILGSDRMTRLVTEFFIEHDNDRYKAVYEVDLSVDSENKGIQIRNEKLNYLTRGADWKAERCVEFENPYYNNVDLLSNLKLSVTSKNIKLLQKVAFLANMQNLALICSQKYISVFFNSLVKDSVENLDSDKEAQAFMDVIKGIMQFGWVDLRVIKVNQLGSINNSQTIPINVHRETNSMIMQGLIHLHIVGVSEIPEIYYNQVEHAINAINIAMRAIVPNLQIELEKKSKIEKKDGTKVIQADVYSNRNGKRFLIRYESEGIKRIISILNYLISVYNDKGVCLVIDELDSGIFEYLLGELLGVLHREMKGQLIFTSHNLRILEKLDSKNIVCSTVNPENRYIRLTGIEKNHNKRDFYIRTLTVGGQSEELYDEDDLIAMGYAFRKAGGADNSKVKLTFSPEFEEKLREEE